MVVQLMNSVYFYGGLLSFLGFSRWSSNGRGRRITFAIGTGGTIDALFHWFLGGAGAHRARTLTTITAGTVHNHGNCNGETYQTNGDECWTGIQKGDKVKVG